jgi:predicted Zn-dependent peptidase
VVAGDFQPAETKKLIDTYFASIPKGAPIVRDLPQEDPITKQTVMTYYDPNIQLPAYLYTYRTASNKTRDSKVLDMLSSYLSNGKSSVLYKKLVDQEKKALQVQAINLGQEDYSVFAFFAIPLGETTETTLRADIDAEVKKLQTNLISEDDFQKLQNQFENQFVNANSSIQGIASSLATNHVLQGDANLINNEIEVYRKITREDIREVAKKYLNSSQRVIINYLPEKK